MLGATDAVALTHPELGAVMRLARPLVAAVVVLASAGVGYVGSRMWPLPTHSGPVMHLPAGGSTSSADPDSREGSPTLASQVSNSAVATDPSASLDHLFQSARPVPANVPQTASINTQGSPTGSPGSSAAVLYQGPGGQDGRGSPKTSAAASKNKRTAITRHKAASARASRAPRGQGTGRAAPNAVEFAPNPRPNQASRDYMGSASRN